MAYQGKKESVAQKGAAEGRILVVEDSKTYAVMLKARLEECFDIEPLICNNFEDLQRAVADGDEPISLAISDLHVPGTQDGGAVELLIEHNIPTIVFTGAFSNEVRETVLNKKIVDYVIKDCPQAIDRLLDTLVHVQSTRGTHILVVNGVNDLSEQMEELLQHQLMHVTVAKNGAEALKILKSDRSITTMVTDFKLDDMTGEVLVRKIRSRRRHSRLRIVGAISDDDRLNSAYILKAGADDFIRTPFIPEEFLWRIGQNILAANSVAKLHDMAERDFLTGLYNRRFFFEDGPARIESAEAKNETQCMAIIDIDHFKKLNDTYGHEIGDVVLKEVAKRFDDIAGSDHLLARLGGEEFAVLIENSNIERAKAVCESLRLGICEKPMDTDEGPLDVSVSIGLALVTGDETFDNYLNAADQYLYLAKHAGRNQVMVEIIPD